MAPVVWRASHNATVPSSERHLGFPWYHVSRCEEASRSQLTFRATALPSSLSSSLTSSTCSTAHPTRIVTSDVSAPTTVCQSPSSPYPDSHTGVASTPTFTFRICDCRQTQRSSLLVIGSGSFDFGTCLESMWGSLSRSGLCSLSCSTLMPMSL